MENMRKKALYEDMKKLVTDYNHVLNKLLGDSEPGEGDKALDRLLTRLKCDRCKH